MESHIDRMKEEFNELSDKVKKLNEFVYSNETFETLDKDERFRMIKQLAHMQSYRKILNERLVVAQDDTLK